MCVCGMHIYIYIYTCIIYIYIFMCDLFKTISHLSLIEVCTQDPGIKNIWQAGAGPPALNFICKLS